MKKRNWKYWAYLGYLIAVLISLFVLAWDSDHFGERHFPTWFLHTCGVLYFSFWIKLMVEIITPKLAFWQGHIYEHQHLENAHGGEQANHSQPL